ncbi:MAG: hypothetical protein ACUVX9_06860 [Anaerolineae bacterium]
MFLRMPEKLRDKVIQDTDIRSFKVDERQAKMIAEIENKVNELAKTNPQLAGAWGMGCGGGCG